MRKKLKPYDSDSSKEGSKTIESKMKTKQQKDCERRAKHNGTYYKPLRPRPEKKTIEKEQIFKSNRFQSEE